MKNKQRAFGVFISNSKNGDRILQVKEVAACEAHEHMNLDELCDFIAAETSYTGPEKRGLIRQALQLQNRTEF